MKAHLHFQDPEWDGEPQDPEPKPEPKHYSDPPPPGSGDLFAREPPEGYGMLEIELADGKARAIQHMVVTTYWHADGTPLSAEQFVALLFGKLPDLIEDEAQLRALWSAPETRAKLLEGLNEKGFGSDQLAEMQRILDAEKSDLFDVLAYVAFALPLLTRAERAAKATVALGAHFNARLQGFLAFVLSHYVSEGVQELDQDKLKPLLSLKYGAIADAVKDLGDPAEIGKAFVAFQKSLYEA